MPKREIQLRNVSAHIESLESRQLLAFDLLFPISEMTPAQWANHFANLHADYWKSPSSQQQASTVTQFSSEEALQQVVEDYAVSVWDNLFGQELTRTFEAERSPLVFYEAFDIGFGHQGLLPEVEMGSELSFRASAASLPSTGVTSVHETGVDEADQVELTQDGFLVVGKTRGIEILEVTDAGEIKPVSVLETNFHHPNFFVVGERLVVLDWNAIQVFDIADKSNPTELEKWTFAGGIQEARVTDGKLLVIAREQVSLPPPELILAEGVNPEQIVRLSEESIGRFETREEYLQRVSTELVGAFLPALVEPSSAPVHGQSFPEILRPEREVLGTWQDLVLTEGELKPTSTSVVMFDLSADLPQVIDVESLNGWSSNLAYADSDTLYLTEIGRGWGWGVRVEVIPNAITPDPRTDILQLDFNSNEITTRAVGEIPAAIINNRALDEYAGDLRVVTTTADLFVLRPDEGKLEIIGELRDFADGQRAFGAYFDGEQAIVTTSEVDDIVVLPRDPLHGIDLSDPTQPLELSELEIPGVTSSLRWVGSEHFAGIGHFQDDQGVWSTQVSLYDISDLANPFVIENWISPEPEFERFWLTTQLDELAISFDPATNVLLVASSVAQASSVGGALAFEVDPQASGEKLRFLGRILPNQAVDRAFVVDDVIAAISRESISLVSLDDLNLTLDSYQTIPTTAQDDRFTISHEGSATLPVLTNDRLQGTERIVSVSESRGNAQIAISADGLSLEYTPAPGLSFDQFTYVTESADGTRRSATVSLDITQPEFSDARVQFSIDARDETGNIVQSAEVGDLLWIELVADNLEPNDNGVFQAVVQVDFDTAALEVVSQPEALNGYTNGFRAEATEQGFSAIGGFNQVVAPGAGPNAFARFQVRVLAEGILDMAASPVPGKLTETLVYGDDFPVSPENALPGELSLPVTVAGEESSSGENALAATDVNADGFTTPIDVLTVINYLNREEVRRGRAEGENQANRLDVNRDGFVTPMDALKIIGVLNAPQSAVAPEGEMGLASFVRQTRTTAEPSYESQPIQRDAMAGAFYASWELDKREDA